MLPYVGNIGTIGTNGITNGTIGKTLNGLCLPMVPFLPLEKTTNARCVLFISVSQYFNEEIGQVMTLIRKLVDAGCDLNAPDQRGERPLYQSACGGNIGRFINA